MEELERGRVYHYKVEGCEAYLVPLERRQADGLHEWVSDVLFVTPPKKWEGCRLQPEEFIISFTEDEIACFRPVDDEVTLAEMALLGL